MHAAPAGAGFTLYELLMTLALVAVIADPGLAILWLVGCQQPHPRRDQRAF